MPNINQDILKQQFLDSSKNIQLKDLPIRKREAPKQEEPDYDSMTFGKAFAAARKLGVKTFKWKGKLYGTNTDKNWREKWYGEKPKTSATSRNQSSSGSNEPIVKRSDNTSPRTSAQPQIYTGNPFKKYSTIEESPYYVPSSKPDIKKRPIKKSNIDKVKDGFSIIMNGIKRKLDLWNASSDEKVDLNFEKRTPTLDTPPIITGDTLRQTSRRYSLPEIIDLSQVTLGYRNRGDYTPISTEAGIITAFNPFTLKSQNTIAGTYMGISPDGKFKVGNLEDFSPEDYISRIFSNEIIRINKNGDQYSTNTARKNRHLDTPVVTIRGANGVVRDTNSLNILVPKGDTTGRTYGNATGGRVIIKVGNEMKLVSGSLDTINNVFEDMKKRNNAESGTFYTLDNGTYARAIRTYDKMLTEEDLRDYDNQNTGGGNFLYIKQ